MDQSTRPLEGLKVVELSIAIAAPSCGRSLAYFGADVMKIESLQYPDVVRLFGSAWARTPEYASVFTDTSPYLSEMNANKRSVGLNLKVAAAVQAAKKLIAQADVFLTNYSTPAVTDLGLAAATLRALNPRLIYAALPAFGSDPELPYYSFISWGPNQAPLVGLDAVTGFADQEPAGVASFAPPDYFAAMHGLVALLTALEEREHTGVGTSIDLSQFSTTVAALGPYLLDEQLSGTVVQRSGNRSAWYAPQGVYPSRGEDRWVALTVTDDRGWQALAAMLDRAGPAATGGDTGFAGDAALGSVAGRHTHHDRLDAALTAWTTQRSAAQAATELQAAGIAAYPLNDTEAMLVDPQLSEYQWYKAVPCFRFPNGDLVGGSALNLEDTPGHWHRAFPTLGEHTVECLATVAGLSDQEIADLIEQGAAFVPTEPDLKLKRPYEHVLGLLGLKGQRR